MGKMKHVAGMGRRWYRDFYDTSSILFKYDFAKEVWETEMEHEVIKWIVPARVKLSSLSVPHQEGHTAVLDPGDNIKYFENQMGMKLSKMKIEQEEDE